MASITSWTRLEPRSRSEDFRDGLQARLHDPLWLLARQWQLGEFMGEDAGSPVAARLRADTAPLDRYHPGALPPGAAARGQPYDPRRLPLEALVEREPIRAAPQTGRSLRLAAEAGLHFLRLLDTQGVGKYRDEYLQRYRLEAPAALDEASRSGLRLLAPRAPDGFRLWEDLDRALRPPGGMSGALPDDPAIAAPDEAKVTEAARAWLDWFDAWLSEPEQPNPAWISERMEYEFAVSAQGSQGETVLAAPEYQEGRLDWYTFNLWPGASLREGASSPAPASLSETVIPAPVNYRGMPASRWWEFEDALVNFGEVDAGPEDLARLLLIEFALVYGNDWYLIPVELEAGTVCRVRSLVVTDTFGERLLLRHYSQVDGEGSPWRLFCPSVDPRAGQGEGLRPADIFFLPPVLVSSLESPAVEEVLLLRDEMANLAWAVEKVVESPAGPPLSRFEAYRAKQDKEEQPAAVSGADGALAYRLSTGIPDYWFPLLPVRIDPSKPDIRLRRGRVVSSGPGGVVTPVPQGLILEPGAELSLFEEEVPRSGARITRSYQYCRWIDGSTPVWIGRRKLPGRGEGSSGLRFDVFAF